MYVHKPASTWVVFSHKSMGTFSTRVTRQCGGCYLLLKSRCNGYRVPAQMRGYHPWKWVFTSLHKSVGTESLCKSQASGHLTQ